MSLDVTEGTVLWEPDVSFQNASNMASYMRWLGETRGTRFDGYTGLWAWSVENLSDFWESIWQRFEIQSDVPYETVLAERGMPGAVWFPGARINYARHVFRNATAAHPAILFSSERRPLTAMSWEELRRQTAAVAGALRDMGVGPGDRVAAFVPNIPQAVVAFLATASIGAIWSSTSTDFGTQSVVDRLQQIEPSVLFAADGYQYNGKPFPRLDEVEEIRSALPSLRQTIVIPYLDEAASLPGTLSWNSLLRASRDLEFETVPFNHPLWVLYSSGTTGLPKPIVQGQGGIMLEHLKMLSLHHDLRSGDRFFWFTTTGWMMWNYLVGGLLVGSTIVLFDGSPAYPDLNALWKMAADARIKVFGTSAAYLTSCLKARIDPSLFDLTSLVSIGSTGSPLPPEGFAWCYEDVKPDLWLTSVSGGTDLCTAFLAGCPLLPVRAGEIQCRALGASAQAFNAEGQSVIGQVGELVLTEPMPSMPLFFWNDPGRARYLTSYFETYRGIWQHGDWVKITPRGGIVIYGRSDATLNRQGVRMGSSEIYSAVEELPEVLDSLIVGLEQPGGGYYMPLFVVLAEGVDVPGVIDRIRVQIRTKLSPRHVPDDVFPVPGIPRTLNGKKLEVPVKKILMGMPPEKAANRDGMSNPETLDFFLTLAREVPHD